jgi:hypothetical protein
MPQRPRLVLDGADALSDADQFDSAQGCFALNENSNGDAVALLK